MPPLLVCWFRNRLNSTLGEQPTWIHTLIILLDKQDDATRHEINQPPSPGPTFSHTKNEDIYIPSCKYTTPFRCNPQDWVIQASRKPQTMWYMPSQMGWCNFNNVELEINTYIMWLTQPGCVWQSAFLVTSLNLVIRLDVFSTDTVAVCICLHVALTHSSQEYQSRCQSNSIMK
jgi:hypothetical protein